MVTTNNLNLRPLPLVASISHFVDTGQAAYVATGGQGWQTVTL